MNGFLRFVGALGVVLSPGQRVLALVAFDGVEPGQLEGEEREIARLIFGDIEAIPPIARSVLCGVVGARAGKSYIFEAMYCLWRAVTADLATLAPGEVAVALIVGPDLRLARQVLRYALGAAMSVPALAKRIRNKTSDSFTLERDGKIVSIECLPASRGGGGLRGRTLLCAVISEPAFHRGEDYQANDEESFAAVAPRVLVGGMVIVIGTPWVPSGLLFKLFSRNQGNPVDALSAHAPTLLMLDTERNRESVEREEKRDPDNARREFGRGREQGPEFMGAGSSLWFDPQALDAAIDRALPTIVAPEPTIPAWQGADLAFRQNSSAFVIARRDGKRGALVAEVLELRPKRGAPLQPSAVVAAGVEQAKRHRVPKMMSDAWYADAVREHLFGTGVSLSPAPAGTTGKVAVYVRVRAMLHEGRIRIPAGHDRLLAQIRDTVSRPLSGGGIQITQPRRGMAHGDVASAFVLSMFQAHGKGRATLADTLKNLSFKDLERARIESAAADFRMRGIPR